MHTHTYTYTCTYTHAVVIYFAPQCFFFFVWLLLRLAELQPLHLPEYVLPHVVHLIAHHPDFALDDDAALHNSQRYLDFLFTHLCSRGEEEYSFLKVRWLLLLGVLCVCVRVCMCVSVCLCVSVSVSVCLCLCLAWSKTHPPPLSTVTQSLVEAMKLAADAQSDSSEVSNVSPHRFG